MITDKLKFKMLKAVKEEVHCFSFTVNGELVERKPQSIELNDQSIKVYLLLDNRDVGKIENIKLLDINKNVLFETNAIYYKEDIMGIYIGFMINSVSEVVN